MRLDMLIVERGLAESRSMAQRLVMAGRVRIDGQTAFKPGTSVSTQAELRVDAGAEFVSRGGEKLLAALQSFKPDIQGRICADVGASTGGFTDCLLQHGAAKVYAIDVGHGILAWTLRQDSRVVVMERQNARHITNLPEPVSLVTVDVSFISLKLLLPVIKGWFGDFALTPQPPLPKTGEGEGESALTPQSPLPKTGEGARENGGTTNTPSSSLLKTGEGKGESALTPPPPLPKTGEGARENGGTTNTPSSSLLKIGEGKGESALTPPPPLPKTGEGARENGDSALVFFSPLPELGEGAGVRGQVLALIKPQFEAGRVEVRRGEGVIRDPQVHRQVLLDVLGFAQGEGYGVHGLIRSPLKGPKGNTEFLAWLSYPAIATSPIIDMVDKLIPIIQEEK